MKILTLYLLLFLQLLGCTKETPQEPKDELPNEIVIPQEDVILPEEEDKDMFYEFEKEALLVLENMTMEEKIGQMFLVRCPDYENLNNHFSMNPGGFIMFGIDFKEKTREEVISNINHYQENSKVPMIIGVDEEGGTVVRVSSNPNLAPERFKSPQELFKIGGFEEIKRETKEKSKLLKSLGINLNLNPLADVSTDADDFIFDRSFGKPAEETAKYVEIVVKEAKENGISSALKHFPGYGNNADTHIGSAFDQRPYDNFAKIDFIPFKSGIDAGAESVMVSHNIVESMDPDQPASLSKKVIDILRSDMEFTGIIMTDDLSMDAVSEIPWAEVMAVMAGNDMLIVSDFEKSYNLLLQALTNGQFSEDRIDESVLKIIKWKFYMGLI